MCGFAGALDPRLPRRELLEETVTEMRDTLVHRGPDDGGTWVDPSAGIGLGSRRLAVVDLSPGGHQPMLSASGRWVLSYNGEIYNHADIAGRLRARGWRARGRSDTEVLVGAIEAWGVRKAAQATNGMFAFAAWDRKERRLYLVRDRLGEKPLYWGWQGSVLMWGSELKAFRSHPDFAGVVNRDVLPVYFRRNCIPAPLSIYQGIAKLPPASIVSIGEAEMARRHAMPSLYWTLPERTGGSDPDPVQVVDELEALLGDAVGLRMEADVALGAFLSGGIDSSTVVALMQARTSNRVRTFTIGFANAAYDESVDAAAVAAHLGTDHTAMTVEASEAMTVVESMASIYDEPFADSSQIPTFLVSRLARTEVTVALSGDGGDETWGGYNRHKWGPVVWGTCRRVPLALRRVVANGISGVSPDGWDAAFGRVGPLLPSRLRVRTPGAKAHKLAGVLTSTSPADLYEKLTSHWDQPELLVAGQPIPMYGRSQASLAELGDVGSRDADRKGIAEAMMRLDLAGYLPDDILVKLDRAAMAVSLETRVPMLDHRLVELSARVPAAIKLQGGISKWPLRQVLARYVPSDLVDRPKMGFGIPLGGWLRSGLRPWAQDLLDERRLQAEGFLDPAVVTQAWTAHLNAKVDLGGQLWDVLMFQAWLDATR